MGSLSARGRFLVVSLFVLSALAFAGAAIGLVVANRGDKQPALTLPSIHPTLVAPSEQPSQLPSETPAATTSPTPTTTATPSPTAAPTTTPRATASPTPRRTSSPKPSPTLTEVDGLAASGTIEEIDAQNGKYVVHVHSTDGDGTIYLKSIDWGDGTVQSLNQRGTACSPAAKAPADCRDYSVPHTYADPSQDRIITVEVVSGKENATFTLSINVTP